jgi:ribonuclease III
MSDTATLLARRLGYEFRQPALAQRALTHRSTHGVRGNDGADPLPHNEQLEFLGDSVLGLLVSERLIALGGEMEEGQLSRLKARLVNAGYLSSCARRIGLGELLVLGKSEEVTGGRDKRNLLADAVEAVLGAVYLDGGLEVTRRIVNDLFIPDCDYMSALGEECPADYKTRLQEVANTWKLPLPVYRLVETRGPQHAPEFEVAVSIGTDYNAQGKGTSKKAAGQEAARELVSILKDENVRA